MNRIIEEVLDIFRWTISRSLV